MREFKEILEQDNEETIDDLVVSIMWLSQVFNKINQDKLTKKLIKLKKSNSRQYDVISDGVGLMTLNLT